MVPLVDRSQIERLLLLAAALESGVIDALAEAEAATAEAVAASASADPRVCRLVLEALSEIGVVEVVRSSDPSLYRLTERGRRHLVEPGPDLERARLVHQAGKARGWMELPYIIAHGKRPPASRRRRNLHAFAHTMAEGSSAKIDESVDAILSYARPVHPRSMIDVGGGLGHVALRFADRGLQATVLDTSSIIRLARRRRDAVGSDVRLVEGDFNVALPSGPFDVAYLGNVFHIYGPAKNRRLADRVYRTLAPGGVLAAVDLVWDRSPRARMFAVDMLQATDEGGVWLEEEYRTWLQEAGFEDVEIVDLTLGTNQLILGRRMR